MARITNVDGLVVSVDGLRRFYTNDQALTQDQGLVVTGNVISMTFENVVPQFNNSSFFYLSNTTAYDLEIVRIRMQSTVATTIWLDEVRGTPVYFSTPVEAGEANRRLGFPLDPDLMGWNDVDISMLDHVGRVLFERCAVPDTRYSLDTPSGIQIPIGAAFVMRSEEPAAAISMNIEIGFI